MIKNSLFLFNLFAFLKSPWIVFDHPLFARAYKNIFSNKNIVSFLFRMKTREIEVIEFSSGTIKFLKGKNFYKVGICNVVKKEYENIKIIKKNYSDLTKFLPVVTYSRYFIFGMIQMPRYQSLEVADPWHKVLMLLENLRLYSTKRVCSLKEFPNIVRGVKIASMLYKDVNFESKLEKIFLLEWTIGPVHGDFHAGNIMNNTLGQLVMIDLDHFNLQGIQSLDAFSFWLDSCSKEIRRSWVDILPSLINEENSYKSFKIVKPYLEHGLKEVALLYVLNRLGMENMYYKIIPRALKSEFYFIKKLILA